MEVYLGPRKSGKTARAVLWLLQHWDEGAVIVCRDQQTALWTIRQARVLTDLPTAALERRILPATPHAILTKTTTKTPLLLDDIQDFHPQDRNEIDRQREVVAYTCSP